MTSSSQSTFKTHLNYIRCMANLYNNLSIATSIAPTASLPSSEIVRFQKLSDLTAKSIDIELNASTYDHEYAQIIIGWLPVKCYYRIYYLESILIYLLENNKKGFGKGGHKGVRDAISKLINENKITFSNVEISTQSTIAMIRTHKITSGANLSPTYYSSPDCIHSVRKKISEYKEHDWKENRGIKRYSSPANRSSRDNFYTTNTLNLTDFFYWLRIKVNYKDLDFLDFPDAGTPDEAFLYVQNYVNAYKAYSTALENLITRLKASRGM